MFRTVLFAVDESRESREAAELLVGLINIHRSRLIILSVVETAKSGNGAVTSDVMTQPASVAELLQGAQTLFAKAGITAEVMEREGKPAFTICDVADEVQADLIVMGSRGLGLTQEGSAESVTNRVISLSPCPILVVP